MKYSFRLAILAALFTGSATGRDLEPVESTPKEISGLEFSIVSETGIEFRPFETPIVLQLKIKNTSNRAMVFPTFETFGLSLKRGDGGMVSFPNSGRDATLDTPNILLKPGTTYSYPLALKIRTPRKGQGVELVFNDGTGSWAITPVTNGHYLVALSLRSDSSSSMRPAKPLAPLWSGSGQTNEVDIVIAGIPTPAQNETGEQAAPSDGDKPAN